VALVIKTDTREYSPTYNRMDVAVFQTDAGIRTKPDYKYRMKIYINDNKAALTRVILTKQSQAFKTLAQSFLIILTK